MRHLLMAARSRSKGEDLPNQLELHGKARGAAIAAQSSGLPRGTTYHAISMLTSTLWRSSSPEAQFYA